MPGDKVKFINREISWLSFNDRVLQEADDPSVPLIERIKFLGIFSSNMDEFFRVRVASLKRMGILNEKEKKAFGGNPKKVLSQIQNIVLEQRHKFDRIYLDILRQLADENIFIINEKQLSDEQGENVLAYFQQKVRPTLVPIMVDSVPDFPMLKDKTVYLAIRLSKKDEPGKKKYSLIELPTDVVPRFLVLPPQGEKHYIILLDDVIRYCLDEIFSIFDFDTFEGYTLKMTRDAELDLDDDVTESFLQKVSKSLKQRKRGRPVRFIYDEEIPQEQLKFFIRKLHLHKSDNLIPGARYHNFKDFIKFPNVGRPELQYPKLPPLPPKDIASHKQNLFSLIRKKDILLQYPYHSFSHVIDLLREAAIDPTVSSIKITLYRLAENSNVVNALINAVKNGKAVTAIVELRARFDEEANIYWATKMREEGAKVIFGVPGLKVHAKLCLITRMEKRKIVRYAHIGTGNFNEDTARLYSDHTLLTADERITAEVNQVFNFMDNNFKVSAYKHLLVSPLYMRNEFIALVDKEIKNATEGKEAYIILKMNSLVDTRMIQKLYDASRAGVKIKLIIRGICSLKPGVKNMSENIEAISIVDKYLEHSRIYLFCNGGNEKIYLSSGDWMHRNLDHRVEVACPIYSEEIKNELKGFLNIQFADNMKSRIINKEQNNVYKRNELDEPVRAQDEVYLKLMTFGTLSGWAINNELQMEAEPPEELSNPASE